MMLLYSSAFKQFDPITGEVPDYMGDQFADIAKRAREILKNRSAKQIQFAYRTLVRLEREHEQALDESILDKSAGTFYKEWPSPANALRSRIQGVRIENRREFPNATWPEYFAVLALGLIGHAVALVSELRKFKKYKHLKKSEFEISRINKAAQLAIDATEAISFADAIILKSKSAAIQRHAKTKELKDSVINRYIELKEINPKITNRNAAMKIWEQLPKTEQEILHTDDPEVRLAKWIGEYKQNPKNSK